MRYLLLFVVITMNVMTPPLQAEDGVLAYGKNSQGETVSANVCRYEEGALFQLDERDIIFQIGGKLENLLNGAHRTEIFALQLSNDASMMASLSSNSLKIWKFGTKQEKHSGKIYDVSSAKLKHHFQGEFKKGDKVVFLFTGNEVAVYGLRNGKFHKSVFSLKSKKQ